MRAGREVKLLQMNTCYIRGLWEYVPTGALLHPIGQHLGRSVVVRLSKAGKKRGVASEKCDGTRPSIPTDSPCAELENSVLVRGRQI